MHFVCSICAEQFDREADVSAVPCGHTFHDHCLMRWMEQSNTCPQCRLNVNRRSVIHKLFFDLAEDEGDNCDVGKVKNELDTVRLVVKQKEREKNELFEELKALQKQLAEVEKNKRKTHDMYKREQQTNQSLRSELSYYQDQQKEAQNCKEETKRLRKKLQDLQSVELVIKGQQEDVQELVNHWGSGEGAVKQLCTYVTLLKQEQTTIKQERNQLRTDIDKHKKELASKKKLLQDRTEELLSAKEMLRMSEEDLKHAEKERMSLRKKIEKLEKAIGSPNSTAASFAHRLLHESPAPQLSTPVGGDTEAIDLDVTPDLFQSPVPVKPSPNTVAKRECNENNLQYVKITSAATNSTNNPAKKLKCDLEDISNMPDFGQYSIFNKNKAGSQSSVFRTGYNGLGGHMTFVQPLPRPLTAKVKSSKGPSLKTFNKSSKRPPLPTLSRFVSPEPK
ncbi:E3 ubiquitin-protein ligase TRAIP [Lingula anatina]|uniref:E3 ubiquitin-protein ligase TRAIP n=1 Tax=Lingula anatina TaxID=7574 RepID=A0A1S3H2Y9_LINAN|nr:E3 ubiquitin-protein ligase TRAIP [Lingula anatina]XP_013379846.1 E3 ubiquitin-protein ligase TRAIP [Lingula anatina]|eukprot:XP_013379845.1 E3 ubiquitin-protein ligase TRAIP [Lingula anatina]